MAAQVKVVNYIENIQDLDISQIAVMLQEACDYASMFENNNYPQEIYQTILQYQYTDRFQQGYSIDNSPNEYVIFEVEATWDDKFSYSIEFWQNGDGSFDIRFNQLYNNVNENNSYEYLYHCSNDKLYYNTPLNIYQD